MLAPNGSFVLQKLLHTLLEPSPVHAVENLLLLGAAVGHDLFLHIQEHQRLSERLKIEADASCPVSSGSTSVCRVIVSEGLREGDFWGDSGGQPNTTTREPFREPVGVSWNIVKRIRAISASMAERVRAPRLYVRQIHTHGRR